MLPIYAALAAMVSATSFAGSWIPFPLTKATGSKGRLHKRAPAEADAPL